MYIIVYIYIYRERERDMLLCNATMRHVLLNALFKCVQAPIPAV